jgi:hypothetical protein
MMRTKDNGEDTETAYILLNWASDFSELRIWVGINPEFDSSLLFKLLISKMRSLKEKERRDVKSIR